VVVVGWTIELDSLGTGCKEWLRRGRGGALAGNGCCCGWCVPVVPEWLPVAAVGRV
jgi:hypothetical protein